MGDRNETSHMQALVDQPDAHEAALTCPDLGETIHNKKVTIQGPE